MRRAHAKIQRQNCVGEGADFKDDFGHQMEAYPEGDITHEHSRSSVVEPLAELGRDARSPLEREPNRNEAGDPRELPKPNAERQRS